MKEKTQINFSNIIRYFDIAEASRKNTEEFSLQILKVINNTDELVEVASSVHNEAIISVVFSTMTLEAFINEYGIKHSSKSYFDNHLDQLKLLSKFIIIPKLNDRIGIDIEKQEFEDLKWLIKLRNELIHFKKKTKHAAIIDMLKPLEQSDFIQKEHAQKAINTVRNVIRILDSNLYSYIEEKSYSKIFKEKNKKKEKY